MSYHSVILAKSLVNYLRQKIWVNQVVQREEGKSGHSPSADFTQKSEISVNMYRLNLFSMGWREFTDPVFEHVDITYNAKLSQMISFFTNYLGRTSDWQLINK